MASTLLTLMTLPTLMDLVRRSTDYLQGRGIEHARRETEWIFAETLGLTRMELYTRFDMPVDEDEVVRLRALVQRRGKREPLAYVLGSQDFHGLTLCVGPGVLVPRPETAELVDNALRNLGERSDVRVLDVGTGSGAIALAIKHARPQWSVSACDLSADALAIARQNGEQLALDIAWTESDLANAMTGPFELVVANLPYIADNERDLCDPELAFEPAMALFADNDGLQLIERLIADLARIVAPDGQVYLEHGFQQGPTVVALAQQHGWTATTLRDGAGRDRICHIVGRA